MPSRASLLVIFETHPVQYRAPIYVRLQQLCPDSFHVVYASDYSMRGGKDPGFSQPITWDTDLLEGYPSTVLCSVLVDASAKWNAFNGSGVKGVIQRLHPSAIMLNSLNYRYDAVALSLAWFKGIPVWIRCETQDQAFSRSWLKSLLRYTYYRCLYAGISRAFPIGRLNREHWLRHGLRPRQLRYARYCTPDRSAQLSLQERHNRRQALRCKLGIPTNHLVAAFFGKFIAKKNPDLLLQSVPHLSPSIRQKLSLLFVGSGELEVALRAQASTLKYNDGINIHFAGFVNQSALLDWYLAADVVVLPSRRAGETWGLVVNEALQAGCSVVVSDAVGCAADFGGWERFRTIPVGSPLHLAGALEELETYQRSFNWAEKLLQSYSIEAAAQALATAISELS